MPHDVVIIGGGHNGLTAAAYLARAGLSVLLLERDDHLGGAAVSAQAFEGVDARLSRYSYLVSLLPAAHHRRPRARRAARASPLLVVHARPGRPLARPAHRPRGGRRGIRRRLRARRRRGRRRRLGRVLRRDRRARGAALPDAHRAAAHPRRGARRSSATTAPGPTSSSGPSASVIDERFASDLVRGVVATDGLIGTFTDLDDPRSTRTAASSTT